MADEHHRVAYALHRADRVLGVALDAALRPLGITAAQAGALLHLDRYPAASMAQLARLASVSPQTMHRLVVSLERRGFVQRRQLDGDKKTLEVAITEKGVDVLLTAEGALRREQDSILEQFAPDELTQFTEFLERFERTFSVGPGEQ
jgi:DNA-binding MarR family transcriptional regulator